MLVAKQLLVAVDFHTIFSILWKSVATSNGVVAAIPQNVFFTIPLITMIRSNPAG